MGFEPSLDLAGLAFFATAHLLLRSPGPRC
jgi:hypothetical protein